MPIIIYALENGTEKGKDDAKKELARLARGMDELVRERKQMTASLNVICTDPKISAWLAKNDPKALEQRIRVFKGDTLIAVIH